jgi:glycosyltransferase involved in cell wall biosynthesis
MPELIEHGVNGFLVADKHQAIEHIDRITTIQRRDCRRIVEERFTVNRMVEQYRHVYALMLEKVA